MFTYLALSGLLKVISLSMVGEKGTSRANFHLLFCFFWASQLTSFLSSCTEEKNSYICHVYIYFSSHISPQPYPLEHKWHSQAPEHSRNIMSYIISYFRLNFIIKHMAFLRNAELFLGSWPPSKCARTYMQKPKFGKYSFSWCFL